MSSKILKPDWFDRPTLDVARDLIGMKLCRKMPHGDTLRLTINETEAYDGPEDLACHAHTNRRTPRNAVMFGSAGHYYVYLCYGVHWLLNIVTGPEGYPAAVLLRGAGEADGPGKLTKRLAVDKSQNLQPTGKAAGLWVERNGEPVSEDRIVRTPRIGIGYAGDHWANVPYRFVLKPSH